LPLAIASTRQSAGSRITAVALGRAAAELLRQRLPLFGRHHVEGELDARHPRNLREDALDLFLERVSERSSRRW